MIYCQKQNTFLHIVFFQVIRPHVPLIKFPPRNAVPVNSNTPKGAASHPTPSKCMIRGERERWPDIFFYIEKKKF